MDQRSFREAADINATADPILRLRFLGQVSPEWMSPRLFGSAATSQRTLSVPGISSNAPTDDAPAYWSLTLCSTMWQSNGITSDHDGGWSDAFLKKVGLADLKAKWPSTIVPLGKGSGVLSTQAAKDLGLCTGTPVAQGGIDAYLGMLGMGAVGPGDLAMIMGSSTCHLAMSAKPLLGSGMLGCYPDAVVEGTFTLEGGQTATGSIVDWYRQHFAGNESAEAERSGKHVYEVLDAKAAAVPPGCAGLICLDYWQGNRCPRRIHCARRLLGIDAGTRSGPYFPKHL